MIENEFARRNDRLISKRVFRFGLTVYTVLFVAATAAFAAAPPAETEIACRSAMRPGKPTGKLFRGPAEFLQGRRKAAPLKLAISFQTQAYRTATPQDFLSEAVRIWCTIHRTYLE
jgi:hypothetical protein